MATLRLFFALPPPRLLLRLHRPKPLFLPRTLALLPLAMSSPCSSRSAARITPLEPQWACSRCTLLNPGKFGTCDACAAARPVEVPSSSSPSPVRIPPLGRSELSAPPQWVCSRCTLCNHGSSPTCDACGDTRPVEVDTDEALDLSTVVRSSPPPSPVRSPSLGASELSAAPQWVCSRCTLCNRGSSRTCDACGDTRPVKIDADDALDLSAVAGASFLPLRQRSRKRDRAPSPDVVEACTEEGNGAEEGGKAPAKKVKSETRLDKKTIKVMTYNVWFREDLELHRRMHALGDLIQHHSPDLICFQEVTPNIYLLLQKSDWWEEYKCSLSHKMAIERPYYCMQMSKFPVNSFDHVPFANSIMGRELCIADVNIGGVIKLALATSHLESPCPGPPTWDQMFSKERVAQAHKSLRILGDFRNAIFCGDMNWDDKGDGPFPLPEGWIDAWAELKPDENGWTYDTKANGMLSGNRKLQKRLDRFVCKLADFKIDSIEMIGMDAIPGISYLKEKKVCKEVRKLELPVLPSDHFGLVLSITPTG